MSYQCLSHRTHWTHWTPDCQLSVVLHVDEVLSALDLGAPLVFARLTSIRLPSCTQQEDSGKSDSFVLFQENLNQQTSTGDLESSDPHFQTRAPRHPDVIPSCNSIKREAERSLPSNSSTSQLERKILSPIY